MREPPPSAPRNLARLACAARYETALPPGEALAAAQALLAARRFRVRGGDGWVSAEKGYRREAGNLLFHLALTGMLISVALGGLSGYKANRLLVEGGAFADTVSSLDAHHPGRLASPADLAPFTMTLDRFRARYLGSGPMAGQPASFAAVLGSVYLVAERHERLAAAGRAVAGHEIWRRLPGPEALDRLVYRVVVFGFPVWTFGLIAGAIWADQAWGRYWGWDPVETWAFITWVVYAAFLHARATAGWRGRRAAWIQLAGFGCVLFNVIGVQVFITGLHSYAGLS